MLWIAMTAMTVRTMTTKQPWGQLPWRSIWVSPNLSGPVAVKLPLSIPLAKSTSTVGSKIQEDCSKASWAGQFTPTDFTSESTTFSLSSGAIKSAGYLAAFLCTFKECRVVKEDNFSFQRILNTTFFAVFPCVKSACIAFIYGWTLTMMQPIMQML